MNTDIADKLKRAAERHTKESNGTVLGSNTAISQHVGKIVGYAVSMGQKTYGSALPTDVDKYFRAAISKINEVYLLDVTVAMTAAKEMYLAREHVISGDLLTVGHSAAVIGGLDTAFIVLGIDTVHAIAAELS